MQTLSKGGFNSWRNNFGDEETLGDAPKRDGGVLEEAGGDQQEESANQLRTKLTQSPQLRALSQLKANKIGFWSKGGDQRGGRQ